MSQRVNQNIEPAKNEEMKISNVPMTPFKPFYDFKAKLYLKMSNL